MRKELIAVQTGILCAFIVLLALYLAVVGVTNLEWSHGMVLLSLGMSLVTVSIITSVCTRKGACGGEDQEDADGAASDAHSGHF